MYKIYAKHPDYAPLAELVDEAETSSEAQRLQHEYELAFGKEWFLFRKQVDEQVDEKV